MHPDVECAQQILLRIEIHVENRKFPELGACGEIGEDGFLGGACRAPRRGHVYEDRPALFLRRLKCFCIERRAFGGRSGEGADEKAGGEPSQSGSAANAHGVSFQPEK